MATFEDIPKLVNAEYSERARTVPDASFVASVAASVGFTEEQLASVPSGANLGLSCGNPVTATEFVAGEAVLDLGSGGGFDVFLAADRVGSLGKVVGLDMSKDMIDLARRNAKVKGMKPPHVAFAQASLSGELPIESASVDCVLSNCVLNLLPGPGKASIFKEMFRVLKPNGRISVADIVAIRELPDEIVNDMALYVKCVSGAISSTEYERLLNNAGFIEISLVNTNKGLASCRLKSPVEGQTPTCCNVDSSSSVDIAEFVASYQISARKPYDPATAVSTTVLKNWQDAYPAVQATPDPLTAEEVAALIRDPTKTDRDFTVVDVRRNDHAGGHVRGSYQCPAQSFYDDAPEYFNKFKNSKAVIFYCQSSNGRGPRCAGWYQDYLNSVGHTDSRAYVMAGGIKGWMAKYKGNDDLVDYD